MKIHHRPWHSAMLLSLACMLVAANAEAAEPANSFTFKYAPASGTRFVQTYLLARERALEGLPVQHDWAESKTAVSIDKLGNGYQVLTKPLSTVMKRDDEIIDDPVSAVLSDIAPAYIVAEDGQIKEVQGFAGISEKLAAALPPAVAQALSSLISEPAMVEREKADWRGRFGDFAGKSFKIGDSIEATLPYKMPNGESVEHMVQTYFTRMEPCPPGQCVRIDVSFESALEVPTESTTPAAKPAEPPAPGEPTAPAADAAASAPAVAPMPIPKRRVSGSVSRLIDPNTMLIYSEEQAKTITMPVEVPGRGKQTAVYQENSRYTFAYE